MARTLSTKYNTINPSASQLPITKTTYYIEEPCSESSKCHSGSFYDPLGQTCVPNESVYPKPTGFNTTTTRPGDNMFTTTVSTIVTHTIGTNLLTTPETIFIVETPTQYPITSTSYTSGTNTIQTIIQ